MNNSFFDIIWYILWHPSLIFLHLVKSCTSWIFFWVLTEAIVVVVAAAAVNVNIYIYNLYFFCTLYLSLVHMSKD